MSDLEMDIAMLRLSGLVLAGVGLLFAAWAFWVNRELKHLKNRLDELAEGAVVEKQEGRENQPAHG